VQRGFVAEGEEYLGGEKYGCDEDLEQAVRQRGLEALDDPEPSVSAISPASTDRGCAGGMVRVIAPVLMADEKGIWPADVVAWLPSC
jgi:hypothetical protein